MSEGVPLNELHCPTCGNKYKDFNLHSDVSEDFDLQQVASEIMDTPAVPWFIICPKGHKWGVKTIWRFSGMRSRPDEVQLDRYLGQS